MPFLETVLRGKNVPPERIQVVASHYEHFGGKSPINDHCRALVAAVCAGARAARAADAGVLGQPQLASVPRRRPAPDEGGRRAARAGVRHVRLRLVLGLPAVPRRHRARPGRGRRGRTGRRETARVLQPPRLGRAARRARRRGDRARPGRAARPGAARLHRPQHPARDARRRRVRGAAARDGLARGEPRSAGRAWSLVWQSRSGPPSQPWLEPDIVDHLRALAAEGVADAVVAPDRLPLRPHRGPLRPRPRREEPCPRDRPPHGARRDGRHAPALRPDDPGARRRAPLGRSGPPRARQPRPGARRVPPALLPPGRAADPARRPERQDLHGPHHEGNEK